MRPRSIRIDWLGWKNGLVQQDVVRTRYRGSDPAAASEAAEQAVLEFAAQRKVAKIVRWVWW